jgi:hypothetical protein
MSGPLLNTSFCSIEDPLKGTDEPVKKPYVFKPVNVSILQMQVLKEKSLHPNAKYLELRSFRKYNTETTTTLSFEKSFPTVSFSMEGKEIRHTYNQSDINYDKWIIAKVYIPIEHFRMSILKDIGLNREGITYDKLGIFVPKVVKVAIDLPKVNAKIENKIRNYILPYVFRNMFHTDTNNKEEVELSTNTVSPIVEEDPQDITLSDLAMTLSLTPSPQYISLTRKNWSFVDNEPKRFVERTVYYIKNEKYEEEFK